MALSVSELYREARAAGWDPIGAAFMVGTAMAESSGDPYAHNPSGATGLLQFEPGTWSSTKVKCSIYNPVCQFKAARSLMGGKFNPKAWNDNWVVNWDPGAKGRFNTAFQQLSGGLPPGGGNPLDWLKTHPGLSPKDISSLPILGGASKLANGDLSPITSNLPNPFQWVGDLAGHFKDHPEELAIGAVALIVAIGAAHGIWGGGRTTINLGKGKSVTASESA